MNVFGAFDFQEFLNTTELKMGFANEKAARELVCMNLDIHL
jgi:hypothetical protein